ncbi:TPA: hypothetical protein OL600_005601, partial [Klebsiella pneumoniae]|nr:hypothetical protein [Klebsiella pneumoniae]
LIVVFLFVNYFSSNLKITQALSISFVIILICWITDLLRSCGIGHQEFYLFRILMCASLVYLGYLYSDNKDRFHFNQTFLLYIIIFGIVSVLAESLLMYYFFGSEIHQRQLPIGAVILAIGLLLFGIGRKKANKTFWSKCGSKYSLGVYLLHPFILTFTSELFKRIGVPYSTPNLLIAFFGSLAVMIFVERYFSWFYNTLN